MQAYAELETDTPGQILGVTHKTDGKSESSSSSSAKAASGSSAGAASSSSASNSTAHFSSSSSAQPQSTPPPISDEFTQKAGSDDRYSATDETGTYEYRKDQEETKRFFFLGFVIVVVALFVLAQNDTSYLEYERDKTLAEQRAVAIERERSLDLDKQQVAHSAINESQTHSA